MIFKMYYNILDIYCRRLNIIVNLEHDTALFPVA